jgi:hypothetical protein
MNNLPRLVNEIIGWYQWKAKFAELNLEYTSTISINDDYEHGFWLIYNRHPGRVYLTTEDNTQVFQHRFQYMNDYNQLIRRGADQGEVFAVANLPLNYYYSSGSCNQSGFLPKKVKHYWLPPNFLY